MNKTAVFRVAVESDVAGILEIVNDAILNTTANYDYEPHSIEEQLDWFLAKKAKNHPIFVVEIEGKIAGFSTYGDFRFKIGYQFTVEHSVYVHKDFRGRQLGKKLLEMVLVEAKKKGIHTVIGGIDSNNQGSIRFHEKMGFKKVGIIKEVGFKFDKWLDVVFMQLIF